MVWTPYTGVRVHDPVCIDLSSGLRRVRHRSPFSEGKDSGVKELTFTVLLWVQVSLRYVDCVSLITDHVSFAVMFHE